MDPRIQVIAVFASVGLLVTTIEIVRRRRLREQYALVWLLTSVVLLFLSVWRDLLHQFSAFIGVYYPPSALLLVLIGLLVIVLLSFSVVVSELSAKVTRLTQEVAILQAEMVGRRRDHTPSDELAYNMPEQLASAIQTAEVARR